MDKIYKEFFRKLLRETDNLPAYVSSLYAGTEYTENDLNHIFGVLKREGLIVCQYADNRAWVRDVTLEGKHYFDDEDEDKPRLAVLIDQIDEIERLFHSTGDGILLVDTIHDVQEFQDWFQEVNLELRAIHDRTNDVFIGETLNLLKYKMDGRTDKKIFAELKGKLRAIRRNVDKYYPEGTGEKTTLEKEKKVEKTPRIFISHSSRDVEYVKQIVNLLDGMGLNQTQVFCSSLPGYGIPIDTNIFDYLRKQFSEYNLHVIFVHSENYYKSSVSLNEMGAAWVLRSEVTSILLPDFGFNKMTGVVNGDSISIKLDMPELELKDKLNQLYDKIVKEFNLTKKADIIWEQKRNSFIKEILQMSVKYEEVPALSKDAGRLLDAAAEHESGQVIMTSNLTNGTIIQGGMTVMNKGGQRESARWISALKELTLAGFIRQADNKGQVYEVTNDGYKYKKKKKPVEKS